MVACAQSLYRRFHRLDNASHASDRSASGDDASGAPCDAAFSALSAMSCHTRARFEKNSRPTKSGASSASIAHSRARARYRSKLGISDCRPVNGSVAAGQSRLAPARALGQVGPQKRKLGAESRAPMVSGACGERCTLLRPLAVITWRLQ